MLVVEIKPECEEEYINIHRNPWREMLEAIHSVGYTNEAIFFYKHQSIIYLECPDDKTHEERNAMLREMDVCKRWDITVCPWFASDMTTCPKIFDLNQQLDGVLLPD